jgi:hypothetical protein
MEPLFGKRVMAILSNVANSVSVEVAGAMARPLYVCTDLRGSSGSRELCMAAASMSKFAQQVPGRRQYRCSECVKRAPVSDSAPLRILHFYALVSASDCGLAPLRMKEVRLVLNAPPDNWAWRASPTGLELPPQCGQSLPAALQAQPALSKHKQGKYWRYSQAESDAIWRAAGPFPG